MKNLYLILLIAALVGCASQPPAAISRIPAHSPSMAEVQADTGRFLGSEVRWGGVITGVENKANVTWVEVLGRELKKDGKPKLDAPSEGRFIASFSGFADPQVYKTGYLLTVLGTLEAPVTRPIGEYQYRFPVVSVSGSYLWKVEPVIRRPAYPPPYWWYDPWPYYHRPFSPYYPYRW